LQQNRIGAFFDLWRFVAWSDGKNKPALQQVFERLSDDHLGINQISRDRLGKPGVHQY
jgi:hypothetical protein